MKKNEQVINLDIRVPSKNKWAMKEKWKSLESEIDKLYFSIQTTYDEELKVEAEEERKGIENSNHLLGCDKNDDLGKNHILCDSSVLSKEFSCPICMDYLIGARSFSCGHVFCHQCISHWFLREKVCPVCWYKIWLEKPVMCKIIDTTIMIVLSKESA